MFIRLSKHLNNICKSSYLEKVKSIILHLMYLEQINTGHREFNYDTFDNHKKLKHYLSYDCSLYQTAIEQLINEGRLDKGVADDSDLYNVSLTDSAFKELSLNVHPLKNYIKKNHLAIIALIISIIALFKP